MTIRSAAEIRPAATRPGSGIAIIRKVLGIMVDWCVRSRRPYALSELDDHTLRDIGLTRAEYHFLLVLPAAKREPRGWRA